LEEGDEPMGPASLALAFENGRLHACLPL